MDLSDSEADIVCLTPSSVDGPRFRRDQSERTQSSTNPASSSSSIQYQSVRRSSLAADFFQNESNFGICTAVSVSDNLEGGRRWKQKHPRRYFDVDHNALRMNSENPISKKRRVESFEDEQECWRNRVPEPRQSGFYNRPRICVPPRQLTQYVPATYQSRPPPREYVRATYQSYSEQKRPQPSQNVHSTYENRNEHRRSKPAENYVETYQTCKNKVPSRSPGERVHLSQPNKINRSSSHGPVFLKNPHFGAQNPPVAAMPPSTALKRKCKSPSLLENVGSDMTDFLAAPETYENSPKKPEGSTLNSPESQGEALVVTCDDDIIILSPSPPPVSPNILETVTVELSSDTDDEVEFLTEIDTTKILSLPYASEGFVIDTTPTPAEVCTVPEVCVSFPPVNERFVVDTNPELRIFYENGISVPAPEGYNVVKPVSKKSPRKLTKKRFRRKFKPRKPTSTENTEDHSQISQLRIIVETDSSHEHTTTLSCAPMGIVPNDEAIVEIEKVFEGCQLATASKNAITSDNGTAKSREAVVGSLVSGLNINIDSNGNASKPSQSDSITLPRHDEIEMPIESDCIRPSAESTNTFGVSVVPLEKLTGEIDSESAEVYIDERRLSYTSIQDIVPTSVYPTTTNITYTIPSGEGVKDLVPLSENHVIPKATPVDQVETYKIVSGDKNFTAIELPETDSSNIPVDPIPDEESTCNKSTLEESTSCLIQTNATGHLTTMVQDVVETGEHAVTTMDQDVVVTDEDAVATMDQNVVVTDEDVVTAMDQVVVETSEDAVTTIDHVVMETSEDAVTTMDQIVETNENAIATCIRQDAYIHGTSVADTPEVVEALVDEKVYTVITSDIDPVAKDSVITQRDIAELHTCRENISERTSMDSTSPEEKKEASATNTAGCVNLYESGSVKVDEVSSHETSLNAGREIPPSPSAVSAVQIGYSTTDLVDSNIGDHCNILNPISTKTTELNKKIDVESNSIDGSNTRLSKSLPPLDNFSVGLTKVKYEPTVPTDRIGPFRYIKELLAKRKHTLKKTATPPAPPSHK